MKKNIQNLFIYLNLLFLPLNITSNEVIFQIPKNFKQLTLELESETYNLLFFYDFEKLADINFLKSLQLLLEKPLFKQYYMQILAIDISKIPEAIDAFRIPQHQISFYFYIKHHKFIFQNFNESWFEKKHDQHFAEQIVQFVDDVLNDISHEITSYSQLERLIEEEKQLVLYLGEKNHNFSLFRHLSLEYPDKKFYHCFGKSLNYKIIRNYSKKAIQQKDVLSVVKSKSILNQYDDENFIHMSAFFAFKKMMSFIDLETYPKLRDDSLADHNITYFFNNNDTHILLYIIGEEKNEHDFTEFKKAVQSLPRKWIYAYTLINNPESSKYIQLFEMQKKQWSVGKVYMIHRTLTNEIEIEQFSDEITKPNILHFTFNLMKEKHGINEEQENNFENEENFEDDNL